MGGGFVGRGPERAGLSQFLEAGAGVGLVWGEAGIGKSVLLGWLADQAAQRGWLVLRAAPAEAERGLPFAGLADLLGPHLSGVRDALPGPLVRALDAALLHADAPAGGRADLAVRMGVLEALRVLSQQSRCAVVVDDVQWLDVPTAQGLGFALRRLGGEGPVALFSCRSGFTVPDAIGQLLAGGVSEVTLGPMSVPELGQVVAERLAAGVPDPAARALHHASGGNPMFAIELARTFNGAQLPEAGHAPPPVPGALQGLLRARVRALPPSARDGVLLLAAAGRLHTSDLAVMLGPQQAESALAAGADAGLIVTGHDGLTRFSHPLLAGLAYTDALPADRRAAHARLARHIRDPEYQAWHLAASLTVPDTVAAAQLSAASRLAAARGALHTAAELAEQGRRLTPAQDKEPGWERGFAAAQLYDAADQPARAITLFRQLAQTAPSSLHKARAVLELSGLAGHDFVKGQALAEQAIALAGQESPVAAFALGHLGTILLIAGDSAAGQVLHHAAELARATGNADAELRALHTLVMLELYAGTADLAPLLADVARVAKNASNAHGQLHLATRTGLVSMVRDDLGAARRDLSTALADAENIGDYTAARGPALLLAEALARDGDLPAAEQALARLQRWDPYTDDGPLLKATALVAAYRGDYDTAVKTAGRGADVSRRRNDTVYVAANLSVLGFLEVSRGNFAGALPPLREVRDITRRMGISEPGIFRWHEDHIEASLAAGFPDEAAELADELKTQAGALGRPGLRALADRCTGLVQAATGDTAMALDTLAGATRNANAEPSFEHARTLLAYGTIARRARRKALAQDALTRAQTIFTTTGTILWAQRASEELRRVGLRSAPGTLTETERRIAELVQAGHTNREIAAELFLSPKTVEANLSRIYHKLHVSSRTQLARVLPASQQP
jgi:DNA-binding CsgD family transcriptional regulator